MNREIKFRAWDKTEKRMVYNANVLSANDPDIQRLWNFMQYTGLKDKKGKEIYEGDIVGEIGCSYRVEFEDAMFRLAHSTPLINWIYSRKRQGIETEVIGNIYENKELLNESK